MSIVNKRLNRTYGYDILINTFEPILRKFISDEIFLVNFGINWKSQIPNGVITELLRIKGGELSENCSLEDFFEELTFLNLKYILIASNNYKFAKSFFGELNKDKFIELMDDLNICRRKIAHAKSTFHESDLLTLIDNVRLLSQGEAAKEIKCYLDNEEYKNFTEIPPDFVEEYDCQNNLPIEITTLMEALLDGKKKFGI